MPSGSPARPVRTSILVGAVLLVLLVGVVPLPAGIEIWVHDLGELAAAALAAAAGLRRAARSDGVARRRWASIGLGCGAWAAGQALWSWHELVRGTDAPFPSLADVGFLAFPVLALAGLLCDASASMTRLGRLRLGLDAALLTSALCVLSWATSVGAVVHTA